ncbi:subtilase-type protease inhibitor [Streptomyces sp. NPDC052396]|uniref:subtilase-type protease inhibitor n=1 Tax=Streptomyces sp. NPDC052396 TaxID=3365689 RepID=UPI0037D427C8
MRYITGGIALGSALALGSLVAAGTMATAAPAQPAAQHSLYAPSALVLTIGQGDSATAGIQRAVTLSCMPGPSGTHPDSSTACAQLRQVGGKFDELTATKADTFCTKEWNPVTVTAAGVWEGQRVNYSHTFGNPCTAKAAKSTVFEF